MVRNLAKRILESAGYTVLTASDGLDAMALFDQHQDAVDLLLLDVVMPQLGGHEMFLRAQKIKPAVQALFASGYSRNAVHTNFVLNEGMEFITKPYDARDLLRRVREILDRGQSDS